MKQLFKKDNFLIKVSVSFFSFLIFILLWEFSNTSFIISKPSLIFVAFIKLLSLPLTWNNILITGFRIYLSVFIALIIGLIIGSLRFFNRYAYYVTRTFFYPSQFLASAVWSIIAIVLFGLSSITPFFIIIVVILPNFFVLVEQGIEESSIILYNWASLYSRSKFRIYNLIILPQIIPYLWSGLARSHAVAWKIVVTAEIFIGITGLGGMISAYYRALNIQNLFATILIILIIGLSIDRLFKYLVSKIRVEQ